MKRTEATDEAVESNDQVPASGHDAAVDKTLTMDQRRRRLVRGAAALAPLVLTLRSGALAAASCTGVKIQSVTVRADDGTVGGDPLAGKIEIASTSIAAGDVCVAPGQLRACGDPGRVETNLPPALYERVEPQGVQPNTFWTCGSGRKFQGQSVAILSSTSATSMGVG